MTEIDNIIVGDDEPKIAILCPVHHGAGRVLAQVENYNHLFGSSCIHILHVSKDSVEEYRSLPDSFFPKNVILNFNSWPTNFRCTMGALASNTSHIQSSEYWPGIDYVYIHSDSDLLIFGNPVEYINNNRNAFSGSAIRENWIHYKRMKADKKYDKIISEIGIPPSEILYGRQEGAFFQKSLWEKIIRVFSSHYDPEFLSRYENTWPMEEGIIPTLANYFLKPEGKIARVIVRTKPMVSNKPGVPMRKNEENLVQPTDIDRLRANAKESECIAMKWFSQDLNHPARKHITAMLSEV